MVFHVFQWNVFLWTNLSHDQAYWQLPHHHLLASYGLLIPYDHCSFIPLFHPLSSHLQKSKHIPWKWWLIHLSVPKCSTGLTVHPLDISIISLVGGFTYGLAEKHHSLRPLSPFFPIICMKSHRDPYPNNVFIYQIYPHIVVQNIRPDVDIVYCFKSPSYWRVRWLMMSMRFSVILITSPAGWWYTSLNESWNSQL